MTTGLDIAVIRRHSPAVPGEVKAIRRAGAAAVAAIGRWALLSRAELAVVLAGDSLLRRLNRRYRGIDRATNVLAFPAADEPSALGGAPLPLGDVVLSAERIAAEAAVQNKTYLAHLSHLVVHGVLHLAGHDHGEPKAAAAMERIEIAVLAGLGIANPYAGARLPRGRRR
ncbi:MAG: rRNA maturation RNase YbeY [Alphaproteobacteria bacterium]|nr:rRNA maturation RNase YbeY [Alphaproteobacteria bacterium]